MSFKVGDKVVHAVISGVYTVTHIGGLFVSCVSGEGVAGYFMGVLRHATPEEIEAGHRIESSNDQAITNCSFSYLEKNESQSGLSIKQEIEQSRNSEELEVLEMIDVSPNCEVSEL